MTSSAGTPSAAGSAPASRGPLRPMAGRRSDPPHRAASPLELFFDLCFVVAVAQAGAQLVHAVAEGHPAEGVLGYAMAFFAIWWAWVNFTWFASAYDNDDALYRTVTLVQMAGVLVLAAGISRAFQDRDFLITSVGYAIMRLALISQWLRAAHAVRGAERTTALRYAGGILLCQVGWMGLLLLLPAPARPWAFMAMAIAEMCVPLYAERRAATAWHPQHIAERYGLFTIIVLGESIAAATVAVKSGVDEQNALGTLLPIAAGGLLIVFAAWWIYFAVPIQRHLRSNRRAFLWGYGHYLILAPAAAIGAGLEVAVETAVGAARISPRAAGAAVTLPTALYLMAVWALHTRHVTVGTAQQLLLPITACLAIGCTYAGSWAVPATGLVCGLAVAGGVTLQRAVTPEH